MRPTDYATIMFPISYPCIEGVDFLSCQIRKDEDSFMIFTTILPYSGGYLKPVKAMQIFLKHGSNAYVLCLRCFTNYVQPYAEWLVSMANRLPHASEPVRLLQPKIKIELPACKEGLRQ